MRIMRWSCGGAVGGFGKKCLGGGGEAKCGVRGGGEWRMADCVLRMEERAEEREDVIYWDMYNWSRK